MPRPTSATTVTRQDLGALALEYMERQEDFIGLQVLPEFGVEKQAANYPVIPVEALLSMPETQRAPRGNYQRGDWEFEQDNFNCVENGWEEPVDDVESELYARFFNAEEVAMMRALGIILRKQEYRIATMLFNTSNFTANAVSNEWDDAANATPITDINAARIAIHNACGLNPNVLIVSFSTFLDLGLVKQIVDRVKYVDSTIKRGEIPVTALAKVFGVERVVVGKGMYNTAKKGQDASLSAIWDNEYAMLCCTASGGDIRQPCVGRTFRWTKDSPDNAMVESYREEQSRSTVIRVRQHTDEEIILTASAYLLSNITE